VILEELSRETSLTPYYLLLLARTASHRYKIYPIKKKTGGERIIQHPSRELKLIQSWLVDHVLSRFPVHPAAFAYVKHRGIREHANLHRGNNYILKVDCKEFFPSITSADVHLLLQRNANCLTSPLTEEDRAFIAMIVCRNGRLTIGAPSSPAVSNAVMYDFDERWSSWSESVVYSRYADDLFFSTNTPNLLATLLSGLRQDLAAMVSPRLKINERKTVFSSRKRKRLITGLVLGSDGAVSLGRARKRYVKSLIHRYLLGLLDTEQSAYLRGFLAYASGVDARFIEALARKFGAEALAAIQRFDVR
jgi:retron-type reverse transcriptase